MWLGNSNTDTSSGSVTQPRQSNIPATLQLEKRRRLDVRLAKAIYYQGNVSLGIFEENRHLRSVLTDLAAADGLGGYVPPSRYKMSNELLDDAYVGLKKQVDSLRHKSSSSEPSMHYTVTLDGWDNAASTHILGQVLISRRGPAYLGMVDTTGVDLMGKDWTKLQVADLVSAAGGPDKVAAVVLDSPNVNVGALREYESENPTVACLLCTCHVISLFLKDVFTKLPDIDNAWGKVHAVAKKFRAVKWLKERLQRKQESTTLKVMLLVLTLLLIWLCCSCCRNSNQAQSSTCCMLRPDLLRSWHNWIEAGSVTLLQSKWLGTLSM